VQRGNLFLWSKAQEFFEHGATQGVLRACLNNRDECLGVEILQRLLGRK
jgi:hypothetical protein